MTGRRDDNQLSVLVIDDDPEIAEVVARILLKDGHQVVTAGSAEEAFEQLPYYTFQVAFIDHHLPQMEGLVLGGYLRRNNRDIQLALVTGDSDPRLRDEAERLDILLLQKPFRPEQILDVVDTYVRRARRRQERREQEQAPDHGPPFARYAADLPAYYSTPRVSRRTTDHLVRRIKQCLNSLHSVPRYNERDRVAALSGLLTALVLGIELPKRRDGTTLFAFYDEIMREHGRQTEFETEPPPDRT